MSILGTAITAGGSLLGSVASGLFGNYQQNKAAEYNDKIRAEDRQWALEDYERVLRDSSPVSQMQRLAMAGLNPNLALGGDMSTTVSMPRGPQPVQNPYNRDSPWRSLDALAMADLFSRIELNKSQANKNNAEADKAKDESGLIKLRQTNQDLLNRAQEMQNQTYEDTMDALREKPYLENYLLERNIDNVSASTALLKAKLSLTDQQTKLLSAQLLEVQAKIEQIHEQTNLTKEQIITEMFKQDDLSASAYMKRRIGSIQSDMASMYQSIAFLNNTNADFLSDNADYRHMELINNISESASRIEKNYEEAKNIQASTQQTQVNTGVRIFDSLLDVGRVALDVLSYRAMGRNATRGRKSSTTTTHYDRRGNVTSSTKTDFSSN